MHFMHKIKDILGPFSKSYINVPKVENFEIENIRTSICLRHSVAI